MRPAPLGDRSIGRVGVVGVAASLMLAWAGCDIVATRTPPGPRVWASEPVHRAEDVDRRPLIRLETDRRLAPNSVTPENVQLVSGARSIPLVIDVDVVRPGVVLRPMTTLDPEVTYLIQVDRLRDLDGFVGAPMNPIAFHTGSRSEGVPPPSDATWDDVAPIFAARCASLQCHGGDRPVLGLDLSSAEQVRQTAIGFGATELRRPVAGASAPSAPALTGLAIIEPGSPARSYVVYKVLDDPHVVGASMPPAGEGGEGALTPSEIETLVSWIRAGARLPGPS